MAARILHLTSRRLWAEAEQVGEYRWSTRGRTLDEVGFIHASTGDQLREVAELFYRDCPDELVVLVMDPAILSDAGLAVKYEDGGNGQLYPHLYGPLPCRLVEKELPAWFDEAGRFVFGD